ncbi:arginase family protein [Microbacterium saccharophilum]|uniref:Arginase family protein n=1 Tax=Microbacterium saccharophilum TaxID=1213358 RepID=A0A5C8HZF2_9MICO|nr:arginase family protein [Microbacterium saccharophilum]TXK10612.1 arginase family protein [Microbacterium saccharophilum]GEP48318.1 arginase [Microbacterium saccharophilum]
MTRFVVVPQWQGSPAARAMLLIDGAEAIAGDLPRASSTRIDVPLEAGESLGSPVRRLSSLTRIRDLVAAELADRAESDGDQPTVVIGGDCGVAVPAVAHAATRHPGMAVVWFDAHGDLHSPDTSPSGAFAGMALRAVFGDGELSAGGAVTADRVILAGAREFEDAEAALVAATGLRVLGVADLADPEALADAVAATGADAVYIHVDLDVLDPAVMTGLTSAVPFGLAVADVTASIAALRARLPLAGASVCGFAPATPAAAVDDLGSILRIVGALA